MRKTEIKINNIEKVDRIVGGDNTEGDNEGKDSLSPKNVAVWLTIIISLVTLLSSC
jgi:hypothetical protein